MILVLRDDDSAVGEDGFGYVLRDGRWKKLDVAVKVDDAMWYEILTARKVRDLSIPNGATL